MGNQYCCEDKDKAGDFSRRPPILVDRTLQIPKRDNQIYNSSKPSRSELEHLKENLRREPPVQKLSQSHSSSLQISNQEKVPSKYPEGSIQRRKTLSQELNFIKEDVSKSVLKQVPKLNSQVQKTIKQENFFGNISPKVSVIRDYGGQIYEGEVLNDIPQGFGRFYKKDGSLFIGYFNKGKAHGNGVFIFPDGSFYRGDFVENKAESEKGEYESLNLKYKGGFFNNKFHGQGEEEGPTHTFIGVYSKGNKSYGKFMWAQGLEHYQYQGEFNQNGQIHGKGRLKQPTGTYEGKFKNGLKDGQGVYKFTNGIMFQGTYHLNKRHGKGKIINPGNRIAYEGDFQDGLPHGNGVIIDKEGLRHTSKWIMGVDIDSM